ncbi:MAG: acyl-CoA dehydrogenase family protein [Brevibacillus sp.]|nr:acyl-CoA dehydrogenase family protein [Brevibacillus sp.]
MTNVQALIDSGNYSNNIPRPRRRQEENFYTADPNLDYLMRRYLPGHMQDWARKRLTWFGGHVAGPIDERAAYTDGEGKPRLKKYNRLGEDISEIVTNEGYRQTVAEVYGSGIVSYLYRPVPELGQTVPYLYSYLMGYLLSQSEPGLYCPVTLTMAAAYLVDRYGSEEQKQRYLSGLTSRDYATLYEGATWLTERQGGSDVGANLTVAEPIAGRPGVYRLTGEKFFASNAGAMVATVMARIDANKPGTKGLGLFLVPWVTPDGRRNRITVRRLKEKLGVNAVPSAEVLLEGAEGYLIGQPEMGFKYMAEALNISRICNAVASLGIMRRAFYEARYYAAERRAFGASINTYPMVREMLVSLLVDLEVSTGAVFEMIHYFDQAYTYGNADQSVRVMARLLIPLLKYRTGEEAVAAAHTAIEIHGGNGYIEEYVTPRLLRDAQVTTVWEGTSNILALDLLRVMQKERAHVQFCHAMRERAEKMTHALSQPFARRIVQQIGLLEQNLDYLLKQPHDYITYKLKAIANHMTDLFCLSCIVLEAQQQLEETGNARKYLLAHLYWNKHFAVSADRGVKDDPMLDVRFFGPLVDHQSVSETEYQAASGFAALQQEPS